MAKKNLRDALVAMQAFAEATYRQYAHNLDLFHTPKGPFSEPLNKTSAYAADKLAAAQTYFDENGESFALLAHLEGEDVDFVETETLVWLGNDAIIYDSSVKAKRFRQEDRVHGLVQMHGERVVARGVYLKCLLSGYIRAFDAELFKRALAREPGVAEVAAASANKCVEEFRQILEPMVPTFAFQQEVVAFARQTHFPLFPLALGHKLEGKDIVNGALLSPDLGKQMRDHFAALKASRR